MEGTQPSAAGGDGAPTAMVAVPGLSGALTQAFPLLGGSGTVSMEASLRLRAKDYAAHDRWLVNLQDVPGHTSHSKGITVYLTESSAQRPALLLSVKRDLHTVLYLYFQ